MSLKNSLQTVFFICTYCLGAQVNAADVSIHKNEQSGLLTWTSEDDGFSIELIQLLPDFVRAVYAKHDIPRAEIERIAAYCVFGSILKNTSEQRLTYKVKDWTYTNTQGRKHPVKTKSQWLEEWKKAGITFSWTLLPDDVVFDIGDWQQGFTTIKLPRDSQFDLTYTWTLDGVAHTGTLKNITCAPENIDQP